MKKLLTIVVAAALMFVAVGQASATALETSGEFRARGWYLKNYAQTDKNLEFWDQRLRLFGSWAPAENVKVQFRADINEGLWGYTANTVNAGLTNLDRAAVAFDWANMSFVWPGTPLTFTIGRQDVTWGVGYLASANNRDRFKIVGKFDPVTVIAAYDKNAEVFAGHAIADDARDYVLAGIVDVAGFKVGLLGQYVEDQTKTTYAAERKFGLGDVFFNGKAGIVDLKGEFVYITGKSGNFVGGEKQDLRGIGGYVGAFAPVGPVTLGFEGAYAAGNKAGTANKDEGAFGSDYQGPFWSVIFYQNMDYPGVGLDGNTSTYTGDKQVRNALAEKFSVVATPVKGLTIIFNALNARADQVAAGSKNMGQEVDLVFVYSITDNVSLTAGAGYAFLGDYWQGKIGAAAGEKPSNPLGTVAAFAVKF